MNTSGVKTGFVYTFEAYDHPVRDGEGRVIGLGPLTRRSVRENLVPDAGLYHIATVLLRGASQVPTWYLGLYSNNYNPQPGDTASTFPALAGEVTAYASSTRPDIIFDDATAGMCVSFNNPVNFTITGTVEVQGCFITSSPAKGSTAGVLLSAVKETTPFPMRPGGILRVTTGLEITRK